MPRRPSEVADIGFSLPGLTCDLQDVTKQQQKSVLAKGPVCSSSAAAHWVWSHAVDHQRCFVFPMGMAWWKQALKTQARRGLSWQGSPALGALSWRGVNPG